MPVRWIARSRFASIEKIGRVEIPKLFLHARRDDVVPIAHGRRLYDAAPPPKTFVALAGGHGDAFEADSAVLFRRHRPLPRDAAPGRRSAEVAALCIGGRPVPFKGYRYRTDGPRPEPERVVSDITTRLRKALGDRYLIEEEIGRGGAATVYLAEDVKHARKVAIKVLRPDTRAGYEPQRFLREIRIAARLSHPQILPLHDSGEWNGLLWFVMPYAGCETLRDRLEREGPLPVDVALRITRAVAGALAYAHRLNVIHRDIKPENILLQEGEPVIADFGVATAVSAAGVDNVYITDHGFAVGTPAYMSPEQASAESGVDGRTDQYSLACVLYEMLAGEPPFAGTGVRATMARHAIETPTPVRARRPTVPVAVERALDRALAKSPGDRFDTMTDFVAALDGPDARRGPRGGLPRQRCPGDRRASVRERERRSRERILQRRDHRRAHHRAHQGRRPPGGVAHVGVRAQGRPRGRARARRTAQRERDPRGLGAAGRTAAPDHGPAHRRAGRADALVGAVRPRAGRRLRHPGRDRADDRRHAARHAAAGSRRSDAGALHRQPQGLSALPQGPLLVEPAHAGGDRRRDPLLRGRHRRGRRLRAGLHRPGRFVRAAARLPRRAGHARGWSAPAPRRSARSRWTRRWPRRTRRSPG